MLDRVRRRPQSRVDTDPAAPALECRGLRKAFPGGFLLGGGANGLSFTVPRGELFALLGPSGCGKTTTLGIIGGFVSADAGSVLIDGAEVTYQPPYARPTNTVFQTYALFPHMSVGANVGFGLAMERVRRRERAARVAETLELVGLEGFARRRVSELSGGQQQRAALARALVKRPSVLLLDEPFGALDLKLRRELQSELARMKRAELTTFVHVTHDQEEACAIADRIAVMKDGNVLQVDTPLELYRRPRSTFVASFLDAGTIVRGSTSSRAGVLAIDAAGVSVRAPVGDADPRRPLAAVIPPDRIRMGAAVDRSCAIGAGALGTVARVVFTGTTFLVHVLTTADFELKVSLTAAEVAALGGSVAVGSTVHLAWDPADVILVEDSEAAPDAPGESPDAPGESPDAPGESPDTPGESPEV